MANEQGINHNDFEKDPIGVAAKFNALLRGFLALRAATSNVASLGANTFTDIQTISAAETAPLLNIVGIFSTPGEGPSIDLYQDSQSPAAADTLGGIRFSGNDSGGNKTTYARVVGAIVDPTNGSEDGRIAFQTLVAGSHATRVRVEAGLYTLNATGGDKGLDSINASAVYDDNVLLTDYVFDHAVDGVCDNTKYGAPAERFDPAHLDIEAMTAYWREHRHFPNLPGQDTWTEETRPSTGKLAQALLEIVEIQAVHIAKLHERLRDIEIELDL